MHEDLLEWRREFPILEKSVYLINNSLGAMPRGVYDSLREFADTWSVRGVNAWEESWWGLAGEVGDSLARILGAPAGTVSTHQNVTLAEAVIFSALPKDPKRNRIVYSELNFPSVRYFYQAQQGFEVVATPSPDGLTVPLEPLLDAIDERTLVVPISHVIFKSAYLQEIVPIIEKAHSVGAYVILDSYQSCGTIPFNVQELDVDFCVGGSVKWLCGGPGVAYLYARPDHLDSLEPRLTGWMAHREPFEFKTSMDYGRGAYRWLNGTPHVPSLYSARVGFDLVHQVGVDRIRERSLSLTQRLIELAQEQGFRVNTPRDPARRGGTVSIEPPNAHRVCRTLLDRNFMVDYRPGVGVRVAPHFFNTEAELEAVVEAMRDIVSEPAA